MRAADLYADDDAIVCELKLLYSAGSHVHQAMSLGALCRRREAKGGKGTFMYTGISFFRELPQGVEGAYRLFANIVSYGRNGR